ncbi:MAG: DUF4358 domain-containing protein [Clostridia bacterium]|nr:DUF4358 domain-containing protein [Clostridia bacterium]
MKFKASLILLLLTLTLTLSSCAQKSYNSTLSCKELTNELKKEFSISEEGFEDYSDEDISFLFNSLDTYDDSCVCYSSDSIDICEVGVFHASSEENAKRLYEDAMTYIKAMQEQKSDFIRSYSPSELSKLNSAEVRRYGRYVIFTVADADCKAKIFEKAESLLK